MPRMREDYSSPIRLPDEGSVNGQVLRWFAKHDWHTPRQGCEHFGLPIKRMHKILHHLRNRGLMISRDVAHNLPPGSRIQPQKEWAVPASVAVFL
jgi:hypothetical protein